MEWRIAVCVFGLVPIIVFIVVFMSPESPHWLIFNGRHEDALKSLTSLRGKNNVEIINTEFGSILRTITEVQSKETDDSEFKRYWKIITDPTFLEPFGLVLLIFAVGLEWGGFPAITLYMVPFLK